MYNLSTFILALFLMSLVGCEQQTLQPPADAQGRSSRGLANPDQLDEEVTLTPKVKKTTSSGETEEEEETASATSTPDAEATATPTTSATPVASLGTLVAPSFSIAASTFSSAQSVGLSTTSSGATICYTTDGSTPACSSSTCTTGTAYSSAISVSTSKTIKALACKTNWTSSSVVSGYYEIAGTLADPTASVSQGTYTSAQTVTLSSATSSAKICYTIDGSTPACNGSVTCTTGSTYSSALTVSATTTVKALACKSMWTNSGVMSAAYTITGTIADPTASPSSGTYTSSQSVSLSTTSSGATICYRTDGTSPTCSSGSCGAGSSTYSSALTVASTTTIKALACKSTWADSSVVSLPYTITGTVSDPTSSPSSGTTHTSAQSVTLSSSTSGATICYRTDGTSPTCSSGSCGAGSSTYSSALTVSSTTTIKALACKATWADSSVASLSLTITGTVSNPTASPTAGQTYTSTQSVSFSSSTSGATICYRTDGTSPTCSSGSCGGGSSTYSSAISVAADTTFKVLACKSTWADSSVQSFAYTITGTVSDPSFSSGSSNTYNADQSVTITSSTSGATICHTSDGSTPACSSGSCTTGTTYSGAISVTTSKTLKAIACKSAWTNSSVTSSAITLKVATPSSSPAQGTYTSTQSVSISTATSGAALYYTIDGTTTPTSSSTAYSAAISVAATTTIKAIGTKSGWTDSDVMTQIITIGSASNDGKIAIGWNHICFINASDKLSCTGYNYYGQLGDGANSARTTHWRVGNTTGTSSNFSDTYADYSWKYVAAGQVTTCAIRKSSTPSEDGTLYCWGYNSYGMVGDGTNSNRNLPTQVGTDNNWATVKVGAEHSCGLKTNGTIWCWGYNGQSQLGVGDTSDRNVPTQEATAATNWATLALNGTSFSCAVKTTGTLWCWGYNPMGQLGLGDTTNRSSPTQVGSGTDWKDASMGGSYQGHTCALKTDGTIWCTGDGYSGQTGLSGSPYRTTSMIQVGTDTDWKTITASALFACATKTDNKFYCWGNNSYGAFGNGSTSGSVQATPTLADPNSGSPATWQVITSGGRDMMGMWSISMTCGVKTGDSMNALRCWGYNGNGQLGDGSTTDTNAPGSAVTLP